MKYVLVLIALAIALLVIVGIIHQQNQDTTSTGQITPKEDSPPTQ